MAIFNIIVSRANIQGTTANDTFNVYNGAVITDTIGTLYSGALNGSSGDDVITFRDTASLNGKIFAGGGNDTVSLTENSSINGSISLDAGNDTVVMSGNSKVTLTVYGGFGDDTIQILGNATASRLLGFKESSINNASGGHDTFIINTTGKVETVFAGAGNDYIHVINVTAETNPSLQNGIYGGDGNDAIIIDNTANILGKISGESSDDHIVIKGGTIGRVFGDYGKYYNLARGSDIIEIYGSAVVTEKVSGGGFTDNIFIRGNAAIYGNVYGDNDADMSPNAIAGSDNITISENAVINGTIFGEGGDDVIVIAGNANFGSIQGGLGLDRITLSGNATSSGVVSGGSDQDTFILSGTKSVAIYGGTDAGSSADYDTLNVMALEATFGTGTIVKTLDADGDSYSGTVVFSGGPTITFSEIEQLVATIPATPCFTPGTLITTVDGLRAAEDLEVGDLVLTADHGYQPIRWIGKRLITALELASNPKLRPIRIAKAALGNGLPSRDLIVSPQHRMVTSNKIVERIFDSAEVLIPAKQMLEIEGVSIAHDIEETTYIHFVFDQHEVIYAENAATESLFLGPVVMASLSDEAIEEITTIFPELIEEGVDRNAAARDLVQNKLARKYVSRLVKNKKSFYQSHSA